MNAGNLSSNTLGGLVTQSQLSPYDVAGGEPPQPQHALPVMGMPSQSQPRQPHTTPSALSSMRGLSQMRLGWTSTTTAFWQNDLPAGSRNVTGRHCENTRRNFLRSP